MSNIVDTAALRALLEKATAADSSYEDSDRFIAAAFDNLPALLDEIERLREALEAIEQHTVHAVAGIARDLLAKVKP